MLSANEIPTALAQAAERKFEPVTTSATKTNGAASLKRKRLPSARREVAAPKPALAPYHATKRGVIYQGDSLEVMSQRIIPNSVDLIMTSPPFGLVRKKDYGNADSHEYLDWFRPFAEAFKRVLKETGSLVIDIGGAWIPGQPTRSLYHYELLIMLCKEYGFHLAQDFFWWSPSRLPAFVE